MTTNNDNKLDKTPDILVDSPLLDSQLLKLKIEHEPKKFGFLFLGRF